MKIGIIVAMDKELKQLQEVFRNSDVLVQKITADSLNSFNNLMQKLRAT